MEPYKLEAHPGWINIQNAAQPDQIVIRSGFASLLPLESSPGMCMKGLSLLCWNFSEGGTQECVQILIRICRAIQGGG